MKPKKVKGKAYVAIALTSVAITVVALVGKGSNAHSQALQLDPHKKYCVAVEKVNPAKAAALCAIDNTAAQAATLGNRAQSNSAQSVCGAWSDPHLQGSVGASLQAAHGEIRSCFKLGSAWMITTLGGEGERGGLAIYRCATSDCLDGQSEHPLGNWRFIATPYGGASPLEVSGHQVVLDDHGHQVTFDINTGKFSSGS